MKTFVCIPMFALAAGLGAAQTPAHSLPAKTASSAKAANRAAPAKLTEEQRALHALNRLTFGPRPGDLQEVLSIGVDDWVEQQLHREEINNSATDGKLNQFRTLRMQTRDLLQNEPLDVQPPLRALRYATILFWHLFTGKSTAAMTLSACSRVESRLIPWWI